MTIRSDPQSLEQFVQPLLQLCSEAGEIICSHYHAPEADAYEAKGDDSPLTKADIASHKALEAGLAEIDKDIPILSEESAPKDLAQRRQWQRYWLVDPLDGTREFLDRTGEFTINIALIDEHRPVLGVLYLPLEQRAYVGIPQQFARRYERDKNGHWIGTDLSTRRLRDKQPVVVLASHRHRGPRFMACLDWLAAQWGQVERLNSGSALKFCQLADGAGDLYPRFSPCCEWDTAAGHALLEAAGGALLGMDAKPLRYNTQDSLYSPHFYGIADPESPLWDELFAAGST